MNQRNINSLSAPIPLSMQGSEILSTQATRLGGSITYLKTPNGTEAFLKTARQFERLELQREFRNLVALKGRVPIPDVLDFQDDGIVTQLVLQRAPGVPLHEMCQSWEKEKTLSVIAEVLHTLWNSADILQLLLPSQGVEEELQDVALLLEQGRIDTIGFEQDSGVKSPITAYHQVKANLELRKFNVLSHGDLCLPNILVQTDGTWLLIDWGKAGIADRFRDLASLEGSLRRNIDVGAFHELLKYLDLDDPNNIDKKMSVYKLLDVFWYNALI